MGKNMSWKKGRGLKEYENKARFQSKRTLNTTKKNALQWL